MSETSISMRFSIGEFEVTCTEDLANAVVKCLTGVAELRNPHVGGGGIASLRIDFVDNPVTILVQGHFPRHADVIACMRQWVNGQLHIANILATAVAPVQLLRIDDDTAQDILRKLG